MLSHGRGEGVAFQLLGEAVGTVLGAAEDQGLAPVDRTDQVRQEFTLALPIDWMLT